MDLNYLRKLLRNVNGSYGDFVEWYVDEMEEYGDEEDYAKLVNILENNEDITLEEVSKAARFHEYPEVVIVDDDED